MHFCKGNYPARHYGVAITYCAEDEDGSFWAGNGEYESQVDYCPYCGTKAPLQTLDADKSES